MANKYYELIKETTMNVNGKSHEIKEYNMGLGEFLNAYHNDKLFIFEPSIMTNKIKAIVL
jgi:hypothetical protein